MISTKQTGLPSTAAVAGLVFVAVYVMVFALLSRATHEVDFEIEAADSSALRIFWTVPGSPFVKERSRAIHIGPDRTHYKMIVWPSTKPFHLQFKAAEFVQALGFKSLSVHRLGRESLTIDKDEIVKRMFVVGEGRKAQIGGDVARFGKGDEWLVLRIDAVRPGGSGSWMVPLVVLVAGSVVLFFLGRLFGPNKSKRHWLNYLLFVLAVIGFSRWGTNALPFALLLGLYAFTAALLIMRLWLWVRSGLRWLNEGRSEGVHGYQVLLPVLFFGFIFYLGFKQLPQLAGFDLTSLVGDSRFEHARDRFVVFFEENFYHRKDLLGFNAEVKFSVLKTSPLQKMMVGKDGFVFEGRGERRVENADIRSFNNFADYLGRLPFSEQQLTHWGRVLQGRHDYLAKLGIPYIFSIAPTKGMIYPELMPRRFRPAANAITRYDQLLEHLREHTTVPVADLRGAILKAKEVHRAPSLYYRVDFHWNFFGAFFAYQELVEVANRHYPQLKLAPLKLADFSVDVDETWIDHPYLLTLGLRPYAHHADDYVRMNPVNRERFPDESVLPASGVQDTPIPTEQLTTTEGEVPVKVLANPAGELDRMIVFGDSFIYKTMFYFSPHAKRIVFKRTVFEFPQDIVEVEKPDLLVQEVLNMYLLGDPPAL